MERLKGWIAALAALLASILAALLYREKAVRADQRRKAVEGARATEQQATRALTEGLRHEQEAMNVAKANPRRDHFERP